MPIASAYERTRPVRMLARPVLADLARATRASCSVSRLEGTSLARVAHADPARRTGLADVARVIPPYACAAGRVLLADLSEAQLATVLPPGADPLPWPDDRPVPAGVLRARLRTERAAGRAVDPVGELHGADVAGPVRDGRRAVLALTLSLTPERRSPSGDDLEALAVAAGRLADVLHRPAASPSLTAMEA